MCRTVILLLGGLAVLVTACGRSRELRPETAQALYEIATANQGTRKTNQLAFAARDWPIGIIPTSARAIPLSSPDGRWVATEAGPAIPNATLLALPNGPLPNNTSIEVWSIDAGSASIRAHQTLEPPLILGGSADAEGFLIESPKPDGSRAIGKVNWESGDITWLIDDGTVNAHGSLGPNGEFAWNTREIQSDHFALAVRFDDGEEVGIAPQDGEFLMPSFSTRSSRLSAFYLTDTGILSLVSLDASTPHLLGEPPRQYNLMTGAHRADAMQATLGQPVIQGTPPPPLEEVIFYHPTSKSVFVWLPMSIRRAPPIALSPNSIIATNDPFSKGYLVGTTGDLRWQDPDNRQAFIRVRYGSTMPRITTSQVSPYLLFIPGSRGLEIRGMIPRSVSSSS